MSKPASAYKPWREQRVEAVLAAAMAADSLLWTVAPDRVRGTAVAVLRAIADGLCCGGGVDEVADAIEGGAA